MSVAPMASRITDRRGGARIEMCFAQEIALEGVGLRLRPIIMTSFAFILGCEVRDLRR